MVCFLYFGEWSQRTKRHLALGDSPRVVRKNPHNGNKVSRVEVVGFEARSHVRAQARTAATHMRAATQDEGETSKWERCPAIYGIA